jgi:hypothetical protein
MWYAPDFGGQLVLARISNQIAGIYQDRGTGWEIINTIKLPSPRPFIHSLEPFVYNGKSYVVAIAADTISGNEYFPLQPTGPTDVWIAGIDRQNPFYRQVSVNNEQNKIDPEIVMLESGPAVYYTQMHPDKSIAVIRRALTGL